MTFIATSFVFQDAIQAASVLLEVKDVLVRTGLKERSRVLLGPFSCSSSLEARWCRHSGSPGPEPGPPKLLLDLNGGLLQVCIGLIIRQMEMSLSEECFVNVLMSFFLLNTSLNLKVDLPPTKTAA